MTSNYKKLGKYIQPVNNRNIDLVTSKLLGINIDKFFMPSVANIVGTDLRNYKLVKKGQFACNRMHVGRDLRIPIALSREEKSFIVSPAYDVFEIIDSNVLNEEYLMMWFSRKEFDRNAWFHTDADVRGGLPWKSFCNIKLPVPPLEKQQAIEKEYNIISNRIKINVALIQKLEETAQSLYKHWFVDFEFPDENGKPYKSSGGEMVWNEELGKEIPEGWEITTLGNVCYLITDGKHGDCQNEENSGFYFVSVKDLVNGEINYENARQITKEDFEETHRRTNLTMGDILLTNAGTIGRMAIVKDRPETCRTTFQKSVAILKPQNGVVTTFFLYSLLYSHISEIKDLAGGSTQSNLLLGDLRKFKISNPKLRNIELFEQTVSAVFHNIELKGRENKSLLLLKDTLLSKLSTNEN